MCKNFTSPCLMPNKKKMHKCCREAKECGAYIATWNLCAVCASMYFNMFQEEFGFFLRSRVMVMIIRLYSSKMFILSSLVLQLCSFFPIFCLKVSIFFLLRICYSNIPCVVFVVSDMLYVNTFAVCKAKIITFACFSYQKNWERWSLAKAWRIWRKSNVIVKVKTNIVVATEKKYTYLRIERMHKSKYLEV